MGTWPSTDNPAQDTFYACTNALASLGFTGFELIYLEILHNDFANEKIVLLKVKYTHVHGQADLLLGVAEVKEDLPLAVVKAFLDAINRRIGLLPELNRALPNRRRSTAKKRGRYNITYRFLVGGCLVGGCCKRTC